MFNLKMAIIKRQNM